MNESNERTRVLWLAKGLGQGGMERLLVTHASLGDRSHFDYRAAFLVDRPHSVIDELRELDVPTTRVGSGSQRDPRWLAEVLGLVRRHRIDVVHVHSPSPAALVRPVLRALAPRTRIVYTEHNRWDRYERPTRLANRMTYRLNHAAIAVSADCRDSMSPGARSATEVLTHGVDIGALARHAGDRSSARAELGVDDEVIVVGIAANLRAQKNYPLLLEVAAELTRRDPRLLFVAVGQGPLEDELMALHGSLGLADRFRFLGFRSDVARVMSGWDIFCLSSDFEGLPVALMEAKVLGLPVVATAVGGVAAAVTDGVDGLLVPPRDPRALTTALERVATDAAIRSTLAEGSRASASRYDATVAIARLETIYRGEGGHRRPGGSGE